jgi:hypothetical protein
MTATAPRTLEWTILQQEELLTLIISKGVHLITGKGINAAWNALVKDLFTNDQFAAFAAVHYKPDNHRKVRDKYENILKIVQSDIDTGNQSGRSGDLSKLYQLVQQIVSEIDHKEEEKKIAADVKRKSNEAEDAVLESHKRPTPLNGHGVRRLISGELVGRDHTTSSSSSSSTPSFETAMIQYITGITRIFISRTPNKYSYQSTMIIYHSTLIWAFIPRIFISRTPNKYPYQSTMIIYHSKLIWAFT